MASIEGIEGIPAARAPQPGPTQRDHQEARAGDPVPQGPATTQPSELESLGRELESVMKTLGEDHKVVFRKDETTGDPVVEVRNRDGEVLNQFPPEKILNLRRVLAELSGVVINRMT